MSFSDDLNDTPTERDWADLEIALNGNLYTLRFTALDGLAWANECAKAPARPGMTFDSYFGYDLQALTKNVAPLCGVLVNADGTTTPLRVEPVNRIHPEAPRVDEWADLFAKMGGQTFRRIGDVLFELNENLPMKAVAEAKKARAVSAAPSTSPKRSASPRGGSSGGSRKKPPTTSTTPKDD